MACKVVSIEDEPEISELLRIVLSSPEIEVYSCDNGPDGIQLVQTCKPDLVILDIMLPGMNGWAVYDAIRSDDNIKMTPIVMLSVLREAPERRQAFVGSPIDLYVTKPFDTIRLRGDIERMLGRKGLWPVTKPLIRVEELKPSEVPADKPPVEIKIAPSGNGMHSVNLVLEESPSPPGSSPEQAASSAAGQPVSAEEKPIEVQANPPVVNTPEKPAEQVVSSQEKPAGQASPEKRIEQAASLQQQKPAKRPRSKKKKADPVLNTTSKPASESNKPV